MVIFITFLCSAASVIQFHLFKVLYPKERTALYFIPLFVLSVVFFLDYFAQRFKWTGRITTVLLLVPISILACFHFLGTASLTRTYTWDYDANTKDMMKRLSLEHSSQVGIDTRDKITLGIDWFFEPTVNYYRRSRKVIWLNRVTRDSIYRSAASYDYYYILNSNKTKLMTDRSVSLIESFLPAKTVLMKAQ